MLSLLQRLLALFSTSTKRLWLFFWRRFVTTRRVIQLQRVRCLGLNHAYWNICRHLLLKLGETLAPPKILVQNIGSHMLPSLNQRGIGSGRWKASTIFHRTTSLALQMVLVTRMNTVPTRPTYTHIWWDLELLVCFASLWPQVSSFNWLVKSASVQFPSSYEGFTRRIDRSLEWRSGRTQLCWCFARNSHR